MDWTVLDGRDGWLVIRHSGTQWTIPPKGWHGSDIDFLVEAIDRGSK